MDEIYDTIKSMKEFNSEFCSKLKKQINKYQKENQKLKDELNLVKLKYEQETEIIIRLDKKIYDLKDENEKLKQLLTKSDDNKPNNL